MTVDVIPRKVCVRNRRPNQIDERLLAGTGKYRLQPQWNRRREDVFRKHFDRRCVVALHLQSRLGSVADYADGFDLVLIRFPPIDFRIRKREARFISRGNFANDYLLISSASKYSIHIVCAGRCRWTCAGPVQHNALAGYVCLEVLRRRRSTEQRNFYAIRKSSASSIRIEDLDCIRRE